ncbi:C-type lectin domain family 4 member F C-type lectin superfamily member 13, partial [Biomphalaria glabrata]
MDLIVKLAVNLICYNAVLVFWTCSTVSCYNCSALEGVMIGHKCFVFFYEKMNWENAKKKCLNLGLVLARFELYQDIATAFSSVENKNEGISSEEHFGVWVGATDRYEEDRIVWEDNYDKVELTMFDHALPTEYNNDSNDCAVMDKFYLLVMEDCYQEHYVFCMEDSLSWFDDKHLCRCRNSICNEYFECDRYKCTAYWFDEACQY